MHVVNGRNLVNTTHTLLAMFFCSGPGALPTCGFAAQGTQDLDLAHRPGVFGT